MVSMYGKPRCIPRLPPPGDRLTHPLPLLFTTATRLTISYNIVGFLKFRLEPVGDKTSGCNKSKSLPCYAAYSATKMRVFDPSLCHPLSRYGQLLMSKAPTIKASTAQAISRAKVRFRCSLVTPVPREVSQKHPWMLRVKSGSGSETMAPLWPWRWL